MKMLELMVQFVFQIGAGFLLSKSGALKEGAREMLTAIILDLVLPCNVLAAFVNAGVRDNAFSAMAGVMAGAVAYTALAFLLNRVLYRRFAEDEQASLKYATMIPNCAFLGAPLCENLYGSAGMMLAATYQIPERIAVWVLAPMYFDRRNGQSLKQALKRMCTNPCVIAVALGLTLMLTGIQPPSILMAPIQKLGNCSTPLSMLMIGMIFSDVRLKDAVNWKVLYFCALRLIAIPAVALLLCLPLRGLLSREALSVIVIMAALPGGTVSVLLATKHKMAERFASQCLILSTLLSFITLPCWSHLLSIL